MVGIRAAIVCVYCIIKFSKMRSSMKSFMLVTNDILENIDVQGFFRHAWRQKHIHMSPGNGCHLVWYSLSEDQFT